MLIYLAHNMNYASEQDGYVMGLRVAEHPLALFSFHFLEGRESFPITHWRGGKRVPITDEDMARGHLPQLEVEGKRVHPSREGDAGTPANV